MPPCGNRFELIASTSTSVETAVIDNDCSAPFRKTTLPPVCLPFAADLTKKHVGRDADGGNRLRQMGELLGERPTVCC